MSEKCGKSNPGIILSWEALAARADLIGGTVDIARNCTMEKEPIHYQFTKGLVTDILWARRGPERIYFSGALRSEMKGGNLSGWESSGWDDFICDLGNPRRKERDPRLQNAWIGKDGVIYFFTFDRACVALHPKGTAPTETPFFYEMARAEEAARQKLLQKHVGFIDE